MAEAGDMDAASAAEAAEAEHGDEAQAPPSPKAAQQGAPPPPVAAEQEAQDVDPSILVCKVARVGAAEAAELLCTGCTRAYAVAKMVQAGDRAYPVWRCRPCHAAIRGLERAADSHQGGRERLTALRKRDLEGYRKLVAWSRQWVPGDEPTIYDLDKNLLEHAGNDHAAEAVASGSQQIASQQEAALDVVTSVKEVVLLTERQFGQWMSLYEGWSKAECAARWEEAVNSPEVYKERQQGEWLVAAGRPPRLSAAHLVQRKRSFIESDGAKGLQAAARKRVRDMPDASLALAQTAGLRPLAPNAYVSTIGTRLEGSPPTSSGCQRGTSNDGFKTPTKSGPPPSWQEASPTTSRGWRTS
jgi:hypothetical protein